MYVLERNVKGVYVNRLLEVKGELSDDAREEESKNRRVKVFEVVHG